MLENSSTQKESDGEFSGHKEETYLSRPGHTQYTRIYIQLGRKTAFMEGDLTFGKAIAYNFYYSHNCIPFKYIFIYNSTSY